MPLVLNQTDSYTCALFDSTAVVTNFMHTDLNQSPRPWYKEPYVLMLIGFPLSSIIACMFLIYLAVSTKDTLVRDNYYKDGLAMNQEFKWDKKAQTMDVRLELKIEDNTAQIQLLNTRLELPNTLQLELSHPTLKAQDRDSMLQRQGQQKHYQGFIDLTQDGRYYIQIESMEQSWRIRKELYIKNGSLASISASK